jgi:osmotically-inducible protein OsmY
MKTLLCALGVALTLLGPVAVGISAAPAPEAKSKPQSQGRVDGVTKASRAAEKRIENALKGRSMMRTGADMAITARIKTALLGDPVVSASDINVDTMNGVVHLRGTVASKAEAQKAVAVARKTLGVKAVKSYLKVVPSGKTAGYREKSKTAASGKKTR